MKKIFAAALVLVLVFALSGCGKTESKKITVAASPSPHAEILAIAKEILAEEGYELEIKEFDDYVVPNTATEEGEVDCNYFQHEPYLDWFNEEYGTNLVSVGAIHYEPLGIYAGKSSSLDSIPDGAVISVPNDSTNEARALLLLEANGIITLDPDAGITATKNDIVENPYNIEIEEIEAAQLTAHLADVDFAVINGNYAISAGLSAAKDALAIEEADSVAAQTYANILVVKEGNEDNEGVQALLKALQSDEVKQYIEDIYDGAVVAIF